MNNDALYQPGQQVRRRHTILWITLPTTALVAMVAMTLGSSRLKSATPMVDRSAIKIETVKRGPLVQHVQGLGVLVPEETRWISASTDAKVEQILARPGSRVVIVYGDGSFGLHGLEFEALVRQDIAVVAVVGNDAAWSQIRRGQIELYGDARAVATGLAHTRYDQVVEACGGRGFWVERADRLGPALDEAFSSPVAACVNVKMGRSEFRKGALSV